MAMAADDAELVARARAGSRDAFGELVLRHERAMLAVARAYFACDADAEDAVQDAFVKAYRALGDLKDGQSFAAWLMRTTTRRCIDVLRSQTGKVSLEAFSSTAALRPRVGHQQLTPATLASKSEEAEIVRAALGLLQDTLRVVLMLRYVEHLSYDAIADYLGVTSSAVRGRLERGKKALRKALQGRAAPRTLQGRSKE